MSTVEEVTVILSLAAALDPRFNTTDRDQAQARVVAWTDALDVVPGSFALTFVRRYYRKNNDWPVTPGMIRQAYLTELRREESREESRASRALPAVATNERPSEVTELIATARQQIAEASRRWGVK